MSLKHVILALLAEEESYGYRIHERVEALLAVASPRETSRVYGVLVDLESGGLVESRLEDAERGRTRKLYRTSARGLGELRRWLDRPRASGRLLRRRLLVELAVLEQNGAVGPRAARRWRIELERRRRLREQLVSTRSDDESRFARLLRQRELAHLDVELRALAGLLEEAIPAAGGARSASR